MKNRIIKVSIIPVFYILIGTIFWGNHDLMMVVFSSFIIMAYHYLIDRNKSLKENFLETSGVVVGVFIIAMFLKDADRMLAVQYISIILVVFLSIFFLKKKYAH